MTTDTLTRPAATKTGSGRPNRAHIVTPKSALTEALVLGTEVEALCGYRWVPSRDPAGLPVCPECRARMAERTGRTL